MRFSDGLGASSWVRPKLLPLAVLFLVFLSAFSMSAVSEKPEDISLDYFIKDYVGVLTESQKQLISRQLKEIYDSGKAEAAVVIINSLEGLPIEKFAIDVAQGKLGDATRNNGLLLLISIDDRKYRFEVGRGLEPIFNDAKVGRIGRTYLQPNFWEGDYFKGIYAAINDMKYELGLDAVSPETFAPQKPKRNPITYNQMFWILFFFFFETC